MADGGGGDVRSVVYREEREEERYVIRSITFQDQVSVSFNRLNQRQSLKEFGTECIKAHFCCDMGQNDTIGKIELKPSFVLSSDETNYKNDIQ